MGENDVEFAGELGEIRGRLTALEKYKEAQNGALIRLADRMDRFQWWLVLVLGGLAVNLIVLLVQLGNRGGE